VDESDLDVEILKLKLDESTFISELQHLIKSNVSENTEKITSLSRLASTICIKQTVIRWSEIPKSYGLRPGRTTST